MNEMRQTVLFGNHEGKNRLGDLEVDGRMILKRTLKKWNVRV
jgi:hypothetical protein